MLRTFKLGRMLYDGNDVFVYFHKTPLIELYKASTFVQVTQVSQTNVQCFWYNGMSNREMHDVASTGMS